MPDKLPDGRTEAQIDGNGALRPSIATLTERPVPDLHGRAALLLVESLIHALVDKGFLTPRDALEIVDIATEVETELNAADGVDVGIGHSALAPLASTFRDSFPD